MELLPWQGAQWRQLLEMERARRLPHALLFWASPGVGASRFAARLAATLLCEGAADGPCGKCRACGLLRAHTHPDLRQLAPPAAGRRLGVDAVRELIAWISLTAQYGGRKVTVVDPADSMTITAANSLLKTLEEPPGDSVFILVTRQGYLIPATVRSRCQLVKFPQPPADTVIEWLRGLIGPPHEPEVLTRLAHGAPLRALELASDNGLADRETVLEGLATLLAGTGNPVSVARHWRGVGPAGVAYWVSTVACDLVRSNVAGDSDDVANSELVREVDGRDHAVDPSGLFELFDTCIEVRRVSARQSSLNEQLLLEGIALACQRIGAP